MGDTAFLLLYGAMAIALVALIVAALWKDPGWLRRRGWLIVLLMGASLVFGVLARVV